MRCAVGSWGGRRPSLAGCVTVTGPKPGAPAAEGRSCCLSSILSRPGCRAAASRPSAPRPAAATPLARGRASRGRPFGLNSTPVSTPQTEPRK